eukprot:scaffold13691_cov51-Phaeocystis_antarctica.AAC.1
MAAAAMGPVPTLPVTEVVPTVVTPDLARMAKSLAVPRKMTGIGGAAGGGEGGGEGGGGDGGGGEGG